MLKIMLQATLSADIIASSSLSPVEINRLTDRVRQILDSLNRCVECNGGKRIISRFFLGDSVECFLPDPHDALRAALILKAGVKSFKPDTLAEYSKVKVKSRKLFEEYGVRIAIGIGQMDLSLIEKDIFKGGAITISGRLIAEQKTSNRERVTVKNTLFIGSENSDHPYLFQPLFALLDTLFNRMTIRQSEIIYLKLLGFSEQQISKELDIKQPTVNQHSTSAGWNSVEEALKLFSTFDFNTIFVPRLTNAIQ
jgi:hypothetical protein